MGAYHLAKKSGNFGCESNGTVIFRKIRSEIVDYLQRYLFPFETERRKFPYHLPNFPAPVFHQSKIITRNQIANGKRHLVRLVCWFWKPLPLFNGHPNRFTLTNGKHPVTPFITAPRASSAAILNYTLLRPLLLPTYVTWTKPCAAIG